jgi:hypothetical protein
VDVVTWLGGGVLVALLIWVPGRALARAFDLGRDAFTQVLAGVAAVSIVGLLLARAHWFSLATLVLALGVVTLAAAGSARRSRRAPAPPPDSGDAWSRRLAAAAGIAAVLWCWPPFETVIAGADSTMYVNAGVHLARHGSMVVAGDAADYIGERTARGVFPSVHLGGGGPFVRLPGGLLVARVTDTEALPAFFPLLPVWTAVATLAWGPQGAPMVAPLSGGLAVWAVTLFAAETFGLAAAAAAGLLALANFAFWWFGRFLMPELLACALVWGALVALRRGALVAAGALFGLAGLARAETVLFVAAAVGLWLVWERPAARAGPLLAGFVPLAMLAGLNLVGLPSHHLAYLGDDIVMAVSRVRAGVPLGAAALLVLLGVLVAAGAGLVVAVRGRQTTDGFVRALGVLALAGLLATYLLVGGRSDPLRSLRWLAAYCSWPLLALACAGAVVAWRRGDPVIRLAIVLCGVAAVVFVINPRVAPYHPWAIRRFLPIVIPGIIVMGAAAIAVLAAGSGRVYRAAAVLTLLAVALLEVQPVHAVRARRYFAGGFRSAETIAEMLPLDAVAVVESSLADAQIQVPLWLMYDRETLMMASGSANWRAALYALARTGRPIYWIDVRRALPPRVPGLAFAHAVPSPEVALLLPNAAPDGPPTLTIGRRYLLEVYRVERVPE